MIKCVRCGRSRPRAFPVSKRACAKPVRFGDLCSYDENDSPRALDRVELADLALAVAARASRKVDEIIAGAPAPAPRGRRSGPNIPENDRRTVAVKLRLPRAVADALHEIALRNGQTLSATAAELVRDFGSRNLGESIPLHQHAEQITMLENAAKKEIAELRAEIAKHARICPLGKKPKTPIEQLGINVTPVPKPPVVEHGFAIVDNRTGRVASTHATKGEARMMQSQDQKIRDRFRQASAGRAPRGHTSVVPTIAIRDDATQPKKKTHGLKVHVLDGKRSDGTLLFSCGKEAPPGSSQPFVGCAVFRRDNDASDRAHASLVTCTRCLNAQKKKAR